MMEHGSNISRPTPFFTGFSKLEQQPVIHSTWAKKRFAHKAARNLNAERLRFAQEERLNVRTRSKVDITRTIREARYRGKPLVGQTQEAAKQNVGRSGLQKLGAVKRQTGASIDQSNLAQAPRLPTYRASGRTRFKTSKPKALPIFLEKAHPLIYSMSGTSSAEDGQQCQFDERIARKDLAVLSVNGSPGNEKWTLQKRRQLCASSAAGGITGGVSW